jgi:hypothetical protein
MENKSNEPKYGKGSTPQPFTDMKSQLAKQILALPPERQNDTATVSCDLAEEAIPVKSLTTVQENDILDGVLDVGHPVISIDF